MRTEFEASTDTLQASPGSSVTEAGPLAPRVPGFAQSDAQSSNFQPGCAGVGAGAGAGLRGDGGSLSFRRYIVNSFTLCLSAFRVAVGR